ncbi:MAG: HYR domain-containing protein [Actinomycetota bacterium]|nr:HYR domain-containing protein [Actinomycetota bacterium]
MVAAAGIGAACLVGSGVAALPASAQVAPATLYASATGSGSVCSSTSACSLSTALSEVTAGGTIDLVTAGASQHYDGNFTVGTTGTSAGAPVTIQAGPGVTDPTLDANGSGTVLTIEGGVYVDLSGITVTGAYSTTVGVAGILNDGGTVTVTGSTLSGNTDIAGLGGAIYNNDGGTVAVTGSTLSGNTDPSGLGGAILNNGGTVAVTGSTISGNSGTGLYNLNGTLTITLSTISANSGAGLGGAILNNGGTVAVTGSTLSGNSAVYGAGIYTTGSLTVTDSTITGNTAMQGGGGIFDFGFPPVTVTDSTISGNTANGVLGGGGIYNGGTLTVTDSTISGNTANGVLGGGGIYNGGTLTVTGSTISGNTATVGSGGGIYNNGATVSLEADLLATKGGPPAGGECAGTITDLGYNVSDDSSCGFAATSTSISSSKAEDLGPLQSNGGPTQTIEPTIGNPAIGLIPNPSGLLCPTTDQRGVSSVSGARCDAGSVQVATQTISFTGPASGTAGGEATLSATGGGSGNPVVFSVDSSSGAGVCSVSGTDGSTVDFTGPGSCVIDANQAGNAEYLAAATVSWTVTVTDADLAIASPGNITTPATGANGATVNYPMPTATDEGSVPPVTCSTPSGSVFPVGTTTVTCKAISLDDTNSPVATTFTVTVEGAAAQLSDLATAVQGVGPGKSLAEKVQVARSSLSAGNIRRTCSTLSAFVKEVQAQAGKKLGSSLAHQLIADAQRIQAVLSC